jgi:hypothetical protein
MPVSTKQQREAGYMLLDSDVPAELTRLTDYVSIHRKYAAYKKVMSLARLAAMDLPVLKGFVTRTISDDLLEYLKYWMREREMERLTVRFDSSQPDEFKNRITFTPTLEGLRQMRYLMHDEVIAVIIEESGPSQQSYGVLTAFSEDYLICEVVGPGFDVDDLLRGEISPHERFVFRRKDKYDDNYRELGPRDLVQHSVIARESYLRSVEYRYSKIYGTRSGSDTADQADALPASQKLDVEAIIEQRSTTLHFHKDRYIPLSYAKLHELYGYISELDVFYPGEVSGKVAVASFLKKRGLVFWDLFGGDRKKEYAEPEM